MSEKISLFSPLWVRGAIYFCLGYMGMVMTDLLNFLILGDSFIGIFWHFVGGVGVSLFFLWEDSKDR